MHRMSFAIWLENQEQIVLPRRSGRSPIIPKTRIRKLATAVRARFKKTNPAAMARSLSATDASLEAKTQEDNRIAALRHRVASEWLGKEGYDDLAAEHRAIYAIHVKLTSTIPNRESLAGKPVAQQADMLMRNPGLLNQHRVGRKTLSHDDIDTTFNIQCT